MARAFSGVLAALAMVSVIVRGLLFGMLPDEILGMSLMMFVAFAAVGFVIGTIAERTVCESVENRFRSEIARLQSSAQSTEKAE
jgi:F0F1-type ATP synthase assembly protein I